MVIQFSCQNVPLMSHETVSCSGTSSVANSFQDFAGELAEKFAQRDKFIRHLGDHSL
jgi:hypothetical protein